MSFDRPDYLSQVIESLEKNDIAKEIDWYFFQDGFQLDGKAYADQKNIEACVQLALASKLPIQEIDIAQENCGVARQKQKAHQLFDNYDVVIFFEDDMIVSPYYISLLLRMHEQFPKNIVFAPDVKGKLQYEINEENLMKVIPSYAHFWGYLMPKTIAKTVMDGLEEYIGIIGKDYRKRPHDIIREKYGNTATSHDAILDYHLKLNKIQKLSLLIPRGRYIGEEGLHYTTEHFKQHDFDKPMEYIFESDPELRRFIL